jgi:hypothetical protein
VRGVPPWVGSRAWVIRAAFGVGYNGKTLHCSLGTS